jgi:hypothetical protein
MSCPACHNVHGPKLTDGPEITNAPGMIRTGELIGRANSLNLNYLTDSCSGRTLSDTNELADSTGGEMRFYWAGQGSIQKNGVCNMCHNEREPYWRDVTEITVNYNTPAPDDCITCHSSDPELPPTECSGSECESCHGHDAGYEYDFGKTSWGLGSSAATHSIHTENDGEDQRGPNLACGDCHDIDGAVNLSTPNFISGIGGDGAPWDLSETNVCNSCHSPGGIYDGVVSTVDSVGAKDNWTAGVYDGSDLLSGREKWCVAAGTAGFYNTGHGKHGNQQAVKCTNCHDSTFAHVDGDARTYNAVNLDNYQAGYRLKSVDGQEPMDIPRSWAGAGAWQYRLCFSCHDSAPFLTSSNTNTNFRSDVNNSCEPLDPLIASHNVNKHWYHLQTGYPYKKWDSDVNGWPDSVMSCPACHNVHGPELKDDVNYPNISHVPAMIRTGELIGRANALNLDYMIDTCSGRTHSVTNELGGSTGGDLQHVP